MGTILQDLRYGMRVLLQRPGFTAVAVLALALGIGANTAIFGVVNTVVLRPLPYPDPGRLMTVWDDNTRQGWPKDVTGYSTFTEWKAQSSLFESMAAYSYSSPNLTTEGDPERVLGARVTPDFFRVFGVAPELGRGFQPGEDVEGNDQYAVLSHGLWQRRFGGDRGILGQTLRLNDAPVTVVGVMPPLFQMPDAETEVWVPMRAPTEPDRGNHYLNVVGRLKEGATLEQAEAQLDVVMQSLAKQYPDAYEGFGARIVSLHEHLVGDVRPSLLVLLGAVLAVLLIACANVANLLLARTAAREREIALRTALGAGRGRIVRQLLTESVLLAMAGGTLGLGLAIWGGDLLVRLAPGGVPRLEGLCVDLSVLAFTLALALLTGLVFGLAPALQMSRPNLTESLKEAKSVGAGVRGRRLRSLLVVAEIGLALVLLVGAGLLLQSFARLRDVQPGFNAERMLTFQVSLPRAKYPDGPLLEAFPSQALERLRALPGVQSAAALHTLPLSGNYSSAGFSIEGRPAPPRTANIDAKYNPLSAGLFETMGIGLVRGRVFQPTDRSDAPPVVVINETMVSRYFPGEDPLGKRFKWGSADTKESPWREIVGIVQDTRQRSLEQEPAPEVFMPLEQEPARGLTFVVRSVGDPQALAGALRAEILALDRSLPIYNLRTMEQVLSESMARRRFNLWLLGLFSGLALLLASLGIYGVMSYMVTQRTREIGIRMALGAKRRDVLRLVLGQGVVLVGVGIAAGLAAAAGLSYTLASLLYGVSRTDPATYVGVSGLLAAVALLACYLPARRAMRVDPMVALRYE